MRYFFHLRGLLFGKLRLKFRCFLLVEMQYVRDLLLAFDYPIAPAVPA